jgi:predicted amidohydrolase
MPATLLNEADRALAAVRELIAEATRLGLDLLVLPECSYPAYLLGSAASYRRADCLRGDAYLAELQRSARQAGLHLVAGFVHEGGGALYNGAALISPRGEVLGIYHKNLLWNVDSRWYKAGEGIAAFDSALGRIWMLIRADARVPELVATLAADGAELIALPTCWINVATEPGEFYNPQSDFLIRARSQEFGVPFVCANKFGMETGNTGYNGQSMITAAGGAVLAQADSGSQGVQWAELELAGPPAVYVSPAQREILFAPPGPLPPLAPGPDRIKVALMSGEVFRGSALSQGPDVETAAVERFFKPLQQAGVSLLAVQAPNESMSERLAQWGAAYDIFVVGYPNRTEVFAGGGLLLGVVSAQAARSFPAVRALALKGARLVCVFGGAAGDAVLRARALENRIFLVVVGESRAELIGVNGEKPPARADDEGAAVLVEIERRAADDKCVASGTDIFAQRQPACYRF